MNTSAAKAAGSISNLVNAMLATKVSDLNGSFQKNLVTLKQALSEVQTFVDSAEVVASYSNGKVPVATRPAATGSRRRGRSPHDFPASQFILDELKKSRKGLRPIELVKKMQVAAPGRHLKPSATISTTLTRLKKRGRVINKDGRWKLGKR